MVKDSDFRKGKAQLKRPTVTLLFSLISTNKSAGPRWTDLPTIRPSNKLNEEARPACLGVLPWLVAAQGD